MTRFLFAVFLLWVFLSACSVTDAPMSTQAYQLISPSSSLTVQENRTVLTIWDGEMRVGAVSAVSVTLRNAETGEPGWAGNAEVFSDYEIPYWVIYPDYPYAGTWLLEVSAVDATRTFTGQLAVTVNELPFGVPEGSPALPSVTPTASEVDDLTVITSDPDPDPSLYQIAIRDAVRSGKPSVIAFATPGFCQTRICVPVLNSVKSLMGEYSDRVNFNHVETTGNPETLEWALIMFSWGLTSEPWIYAVDRDGIVVRRLDGPVSPAELRPIVDHMPSG